MSISIDLSGDVAVVTGGGSGIGEAIARTLARAGAAVGVADLSEESAQRVAKQIEADGGRALAVALDIADRASVQAGLAAVRDGLGPVKHLVNNAATWVVKSFADHTAAEIDRVVGITLTGTMAVTQAALPDIVEQRGTVVVISSDSARIGERYMSVYAAAKAGLLGFTKSVAGRSAARASGSTRSRREPRTLRAALVSSSRPAARRSWPGHTRWAASASRRTSPTWRCSSSPRSRRG